MQFIQGCKAKGGGGACSVWQVLCKHQKDIFCLKVIFVIRAHLTYTLKHLKHYMHVMYMYFMYSHSENDCIYYIDCYLK